MKLLLLAFETKSPEWVAQGRAEYLKKISHFIPMEFRSLKSPSADRDDSVVKLKRESELLLKAIDPSDFLILFDEAGTRLSGSIPFAESFRRVVESGKSRAVFVIGGPYGFHDDVRIRAQLKWNLSPLTMNHWIAQLAALEQIYRSFTIIRGLPYHNS